MLERLRSYVLGGSNSEVVHECRECGTPVEADTPRCPNCESPDLARYEID